MNFTLKQTQPYLDDIEKLPSSIRQSQLPNTHYQLQKNPNYPGLKTHRFSGFHLKKVFRSRVDENYRIAWFYGDNDRSIILWRVGKHSLIDDLEDLKSMPKIRIIKENESPLADPNEEKGYVQSPSSGVATSRGIFQNLKPVHLGIFGVPEELVEQTRRVTDIEQLDSLGLPKHAIEILYTLYTDPDWTMDCLLSFQRTLYRANADKLKEYCKGKIRQLMLDLSPDQEKIVGANAQGALLIKGVAGSGKTTVGVYRAIHLSKNRDFYSTKPVLFLTYNETLSKVVRQLFLELTPIHEHENFEKEIVISTGRDWCQKFLQDASRDFKLKEAGSILASIISNRIPDDSKFSLLKKENFIPVEIDQVIKGRDVTSWDDYRKIERIGRGQPLMENSRRIIWEIFTEYQEKLSDAKVMDEADLYIEALKKVKSNPSFEPYPEVVVDEAQDLPPIALELAAALAGGGRSYGLCLLADPSQSIYYKGISWKDGNIHIHSSRVKTLTRNFRNTKQILEAAWALSKADPQKTLGESVVPEKSDRQGLKPHVYHVDSNSNQDMVQMKELIMRYSGSNKYRLGDIAVLCRGRNKTEEVIGYLKSVGFPCCHYRKNSFDIFENYVKVITFNSAKGLEFPVVILMNIDEGVLPRSLNHIENEEDLLATLRSERQLLYVGMTRAADELCMLVTNGKASRFLKDIPEELLNIHTADGQ